jgi:copper(I)-binding protein
MSSFSRFLAAMSVALLPMVAVANDYTIGDLVVDHPVARATAQTAMTSAGYVTITNNGAEADALLAIEANFPRVEVHEAFMRDGMMQMQEVDRLIIPAGGSIKLEMGGLHVMFIGLQGDPFEVDEEVPATLVFEKAGRLDVVFNVEDLSDAIGQSSMGHGDIDEKIDHSDMEGGDMKMEDSTDSN